MLLQAANQFGRRVVLWVADNLDAAAAFDYSFSLWDAFCRVVGTLGMKVRADFVDESAHVVLLENYDGVHVGQGSENFGAFVRGHQRAAVAFQLAYRFVRVGGYDEFSAELLRRVQISYVTDVEKIETAVGERDLLALGAPVLHLAAEFVATKNFFN